MDRYLDSHDDVVRLRSRRDASLQQHRTSLQDDLRRQILPGDDVDQVAVHAAASLRHYTHVQTSIQSFYQESETSVNDVGAQ